MTGPVPLANKTSTAPIDCSMRWRYRSSMPRTPCGGWLLLSAQAFEGDRRRSGVLNWLRQEMSATLQQAGLAAAGNAECATP